MNKELFREQILTQAKEVCFGEERYFAPSWGQMGEICFNLAREILQANRKFERLVTLAKGGWTWSRTLADYLEIEKVASIQVKFYQDVNQTAESPILLQSLPVSVIGENLLLFDDVDDTGRSLEFAKQYLLMCGAREITRATLFHKPWSIVKPDFYGADTKAWVVFPHEIRESVQLIGEKWLNKGVSPQEIKNRFYEIGLPLNQVEFFLKRLYGEKF